jgi:hypothetical protein
MNDSEKNIATTDQRGSLDRGGKAQRRHRFSCAHPAAKAAWRFASRRSPKKVAAQAALGASIFIGGSPSKVRDMKTQRLFLICAAVWSLGLAPVFAQFSSGSTGADGPLNVTSNTTLDLPASGVFHFTTVTVASNVTLRFNPNALNTPVHLLATGDVAIAGTIDVSGQAGTITAGGRGGPGGFKGGEPGNTSSSIPAGAGQGPGGGRPGPVNVPGNAQFGATGTGLNDGSPYGNPLLIPMIGGSGGGGINANPGAGGGGGGGGILLASSTRITVTGRVLSQGVVSPNGSSGSGGAIRFVAPVVAGTGELNVGRVGNPGASRGRIRIDALDRSGASFNFQPATAVTMGVTMIAIPSPLPRLDLIDVAGTPVAEGAPMPVTVTLPFGSDPNRIVIVQARDFNAVVPIQILLTPEHGAATTVQASIDNRAVNPAQTTVNVTFGTNAPTAVHVFTR